VYVDEQDLVVLADDGVTIVGDERALSQVIGVVRAAELSRERIEVARSRRQAYDLFDRKRD
jgi:hypothetical protein